MTQPKMKPMVQITRDAPREGMYECEVKVGRGEYRDYCAARDINEVMAWLADHGFKEQIPAPAEEEASVVGGVV